METNVIRVWNGEGPSWGIKMDYRSLHPPGAREVIGIGWRMRGFWHLGVLEPLNCRPMGLGDSRTTHLQQFERVSLILLLESQPLNPSTWVEVTAPPHQPSLVCGGICNQRAFPLVYFIITNRSIISVSGHSNFLVTSPLSLLVRDIVSLLWRTLLTQPSRISEELSV